MGITLDRNTGSGCGESIWKYGIILGWFSVGYESSYLAENGERGGG